MKFKFDTTAVLNQVRENRDQHRAEFEKAIDGYRRAMIENLEEHIQDLKDGKTFSFVKSLPVPEDHTKDYDCLIQILEACLDDFIELSQHEFDCYMLDNWDWKDQFTTTSAMYTHMADE